MAFKKKPLATMSQGLHSLVGMSRAMVSRPEVLTPDFAIDDGSKRIPLLALKLHHLKLLDGVEIRLVGVDLDTGQQGVGREVLQARSLFHDVFTRQVVAGL